ncbi:MAG: hypothetical protein ACRC5C_13335 [Bacilli bacterium]
MQIIVPSLEANEWQRPFTVLYKIARHYNVDIHPLYHYAMKHKMNENALKRLTVDDKMRQWSDSRMLYRERLMIVEKLKLKARIHPRIIVLPTEATAMHLWKQQQTWIMFVHGQATKTSLEVFLLLEWLVEERVAHIGEMRSAFSDRLCDCILREISAMYKREADDNQQLRTLTSRLGERLPLLFGMSQAKIEAHWAQIANTCIR